MGMGMGPEKKEEETLRREEQLIQIRKAQDKAYEGGKSIEELMADYAKEDLYKEYLVHLAILTCDQATVEDFILPNGQVVPLCDRRPSRTQGKLEERGVITGIVKYLKGHLEIEKLQ